MISRYLFVALCFCLTADALPAAEPPAVAVRFETHVRAILKAHCWHCHGEEDQPEGALDLRLARFLLTGGDSGPAIVPGQPAESLLLERIESGEMPPGKKKLSDAEIATLKQWISDGGQTVRPEPETLAVGDTFTNEEREHWSFQPVVAHELPSVNQPELVRTGIDRWLLHKLEAQNLSYSPEADRVTLMRRLSFDLLGLPPTPEAVARFVNDPAPDAYERLVDELLASPAYGERWARHWLDVVGYADSDGYTETDPERKWAYRYRDYVIRAFNDDKPWDKFLIEQLAGDELLTPPFTNLNAAQADQLIATGYLRMGPDGTGAGAADQNLARNDVLAETIKIVSTSVLGLSVGCAQCHSHRYDPISHVDYHRMRAVFEPAYDWKNWRAPNERLVSLWSDETRQKVTQVEQELVELDKQRLAELDKIIQETFDRELAKLPAEQQPAARLARETPADKRTPEQQHLIKENPFLNVDRGSVYLYLPDRQTGFNKKWEDLTAETRKKRPADDNVHCLTEIPGQLPPTKLFFRGDINSPRQDVAPGELAILNTHQWELPAKDSMLPTSGRRLAYARYLTSGRHPLVARVLVNRFWMHHFGKGIVRTPSDFGVLGERPTHPELLDWLADDFVRGGWQLKRLHRVMLLSTAYRQASLHRAELEAVDPENRLLGRMPVRRLEAETLRDSLMALSGVLSSKMYGPPIPVTPDPVGQIIVAIDTRDAAGVHTKKFVSLGEDTYRRSIYVQIRRSMPLAMLEPFDMPTLTPNCELRPVSTVAPQSLLMLNSPIVVELAEAMAKRVEQTAGTDPAAQVQLAWTLTFGRPATAAEVQGGVEFLGEQVTTFPPPPADAKTPGPSPQHLALAHLCHALVSSNGFLYVD